MKKTILISFITLSSFNIIFSLPWIWQNPFPNLNIISDIKFINANTGYLICEEQAFNVFSVLYKTTDAGNNWSQILSNPDDYFTKVEFFNDTGYLSGGRNMLKTTNAGLNWNIVMSNSNYFTAADFINSNEGFYLVYNTYNTDLSYKTTNGGLNWLFGDTVPPCRRFLGFINSNTGFNIGGGSGPIYRTTNGGLDWNLQLSQNMISVFFYDQNFGLATGPLGVYKTTDSGANWNMLADFLTYSSFIISPSIYYLVDYTNNRVYKTTNSGTNWNSYYLGNFNTSRCIYFPTPNTGYIGGNIGRFYKTTDSGGSWFSDRRGTMQNLKSIKFINTLSGYCVGDTGTILQTTNGGTNWNIQSCPTNANLNECCFNDFDNGIVVGQNGTLLRTSNHGLNWNIISTSYSTNFNSVSRNNNSFVVVGNNSVILKSTNLGLNWSVINSPYSNNLKAINFTDNSTGYISATDKILKTINGGNNWVITSYNGGGIGSFSFTDNNTGYVDNGQILKTTDGSNSWFVASSFNPYRFKFINSSVGIAFIGGGYAWTIYRTSNGGVNWLIINQIVGGTNMTCEYNDIYFFNDVTGWIIGSKGAIVKTTNAGGLYVPVNNPSIPIPEDYLLSQNYPNPFNPETKISYSIPKSCTVSLIVYDLLGRVVMNLVNNEFLKPGNYEVSFNGNNLASGIYFYRIVTDEFTQSRKMILIK
ncbi:MAG: T9SS C-terminal target domain-containing protein [Ignavibacteriae bacterium]|nr:MAG: T9SS C-terminal target domain-containing protein [Ignavibacteriota bacterium]